MQYLVKNYSEEGDIVVDVTAGTGSTAKACLVTRRSCYSFDIDEEQVCSRFGGGEFGVYKLFLPIYIVIWETHCIL